MTGGAFLKKATRTQMPRLDAEDADFRYERATPQALRTNSRRLSRRAM
jgi:hypothetical protein